MATSIWPEAANRRLRALLWKGCSLREVAMCLDRPVAEVSLQMRRLGITARRAFG
jgi:hypothetical protein